MGKNSAKVVKREAVAVLSRGTMRDPEMTSANADEAYIMIGKSASNQASQLILLSKRVSMCFVLLCKITLWFATIVVVNCGVILS